VNSEVIQDTISLVFLLVRRIEVQGLGHRASGALLFVLIHPASAKSLCSYLLTYLEFVAWIGCMKPEMLLTLVSLLSVGCEAVKLGQVNLHDPKARDEIISGAIEEGKLQKRGKKGEELYYSPDHDSPYTGWAKIVYENGQVEFLNQYRNGALNGPYTMWRENGRMESLETYREGVLHGIYEDWYPSGNRESRENYENGKRDGPRFTWYEDGRKQSEDNYRAGKLHGASVEWYPNGKMEEKLNYLDGKPDGTWIYFNPDGSERHREAYRNGEVAEY